uniref:Uncharacterized protein n=1 Tax=Pyxicephalus adspersus TaxID=30357 RepID=A0AAV3A6F9_PYXAD|nr:TPA: hypothetical protein GDO54_013262 [Pyxicephalus adspersus]
MMTGSHNVGIMGESTRHCAPKMEICILVSPCSVVFICFVQKFLLFEQCNVQVLLEMVRVLCSLMFLLYLHCAVSGIYSSDLCSFVQP